MLLRINQLLNKDETDAVLGLAAQGEFEDGRATAGGHLHGVKHNEQLPRSKMYTPQIHKIVIEALGRCVPFQHFALPKRILTPRVCRYREGMSYGDHFDGPIIQVTPDDALRTDLSITIFLTEPESYDGGELCFETPFGAINVKLAAGDAIVYSTTLRHRVEPVTRGARLVVISWIQSVIKDPAQREIMSDIYKLQDLVRDALPTSEANDLLLKIKTAVFKTWVDI